MVHTYIDWASCKPTRRSNSGGGGCISRSLLSSSLVQSSSPCLPQHLCSWVSRATPQSERIAEPEINSGRAPVCCKSGFNCMHRYYASSRSWSIQAFGNANHVGTTNSPTGQLRYEDLTYREFMQAVLRLTARLKSSIEQSFRCVERGLERS